MFTSQDLTLAEEIITACRDRSIGLTTVESCTGGLISALLTSVSGSSSVIHSNLVTYANEAKTHFAHVSPDIIKAHGAVSEETVCAMAEGGLKSLQSFKAFSQHISLAVTGIAGPGGGTYDNPVGTVWHGIACDWPGETKCFIQCYSGDRMNIRLSAMREILVQALEIINLQA